MWGRPLDTMMMNPWYREQFSDALAVVASDQERCGLDILTTGDYHLDDLIRFPRDHLERMLDVEAAVGLEQLKKYAPGVARRRANAAFYASALVPKPGVVLLVPTWENSARAK